MVCVRKKHSKNNDSMTCSKGIQMLVDKPATTSHKGEKVRSYTISFKLQVIEYAENHSIAAAASICDWKKKKNMLQEISTSNNSKKRICLEGGGRKPLSNEM